MKTQKTQLVGAGFTFTLDMEASKLANFKKAADAGFPAGKTSFMNLVNGKVETVKGIKLVVVQESKKASAKKATKEVTKKAQRVKYASAQLAEKMINDLDMDLHVVHAKRKTYATLKTQVGRVQLDPKEDGSFGAWVYPAKGYDVQDAQTLLGRVKAKDARVASQHVKATLTASQVASLSK